MTLIIGAKCKDGVVMVGDRLITQEPPQRYIDKIKQGEELDSLIFGAAGLKAFFDEFMEELPKEVLRDSNYLKYYNTSNKIPPECQEIYDFTKFKHTCSKLMHGIKGAYPDVQEYEGGSLEVMFAYAGKDTPARLYCIELNNCLPAEVEGIHGIGLPHYAKVFFRAWKEEMNMHQTARLASFIIKYIERENICEGIGVGQNEPQTWFVPDGLYPYEAKSEELKKLLEGVDEKIEEIRSTIGSKSSFFRN